MSEAEQRRIMMALEKRLTKNRLGELVELLNPNPQMPGRPEHYLKMIFQGWADIGYNKARWKDDQKTALEQVEAHSRALTIALGKLVPPYRTSATVELAKRLKVLETESRSQLERGSRLNTTRWADNQVRAILGYYIERSLDTPNKTATGGAYKFLIECMKTLTGEHPKEDGPGGLRGAYKRILPEAIYNHAHRLDFLGG